MPPYHLSLLSLLAPAIFISEEKKILLLSASIEKVTSNLSPKLHKMNNLFTICLMNMHV